MRQHLFHDLVFRYALAIGNGLALRMKKRSGDCFVVNAEQTTLRTLRIPARRAIHAEEVHAIMMITRTPGKAAGFITAIVGIRRKIGCQRIASGQQHVPLIAIGIRDFVVNAFGYRLKIEF